MCMHPAGGLGPVTPLGGRRGSFRSVGSLAVVQTGERLLRPMRATTSVGLRPVTQRCSIRGKRAYARKIGLRVADERSDHGLASVVTEGVVGEPPSPRPPRWAA